MGERAFWVTGPSRGEIRDAPAGEPEHSAVIGSGRPAITLPEVTTLADGLGPKTRRFDRGDDVMFECMFDG